jgi:dolichol-phosphate mannosyltransferase
MPELSLSVVVPCYNEQDGLLELHRRVSQVCRRQVGESYELVLVNDGSGDDTWTLMSNLAAEDPNIVAVNLSRNFGHQLALSAGLSVCRGERIFILDADLQDPPELLGDMMARMDTGCDVVYGKRTHREGETAFKKLTAHVFYRVLDRLVDIDIPTDAGDFRLMSRRALDALNAMPEQHRFIRGMVSWVGMRQEALPYERAARFTGETKYPFFKMVRFAVDAITGFSIQPLRLAVYAGFTTSFATVVLMTYVLIAYLTGHTVSGWASLTLLILAMSSLQFLLIGVMGEYVGRLYIEAKHRPLFVIQDICSAGSRPSIQQRAPARDIVSKEAAVLHE